MKELFKSLAAFQQECPVIHKGTSGYGYTYADLPAIFEVINPILKKHKLGFTQAVEGITLKTVVFHTETGESLSEAAEIPQGVSLKGMNEFQVLGSAITYMRRYQLSAMLGIVTDKDTDASGEQQKKESLTPAHASWSKSLEWISKNGESGFKALEKRFIISKDNKERLLMEADV